MLDFLRAIGHDRVIPILYNFRNSQQDLNNAIKLCIAFTCLWRGYSPEGKTEKIDNKYKEVTEAFCKSSDKSIEYLKKLVVKTLIHREKGLELTKKSWIEKFKEIEIYKNKQLTRLFLLLAFDRRGFKSGRLQKSKIKFLTLDTRDKLQNEYKTIEHITPQGHKKDDRIGNLILLPQSINSKVGRGKFLDKVKIYKSCLETDPSINELPYLPILQEIISYENDELENGYLSKASIAKRGERLGESIWQTLAEEVLEWNKYAKKSI